MGMGPRRSEQLSNRGNPRRFSVGGAAWNWGCCFTWRVFKIQHTVACATASFLLWLNNTPLWKQRYEMWTLTNCSNVLGSKPSVMRMKKKVFPGWKRWVCKIKLKNQTYFLSSCILSVTVNSDWFSLNSVSEQCNFFCFCFDEDVGS